MKNTKTCFFVELCVFARAYCASLAAPAFAAEASVKPTEWHARDRPGDRRGKSVSRTKPPYSTTQPDRNFHHSPGWRQNNAHFVFNDVR